MLALSMAWFIYAQKYKKFIHLALTKSKLCLAYVYMNLQWVCTVSAKNSQWLGKYSQKTFKRLDGLVFTHPI